MQIEEQEIDDVTVQEAIGQVAKNAGEKQPEGEPTPWVAWFLAQEQNGDDDERDAGERDEEAVVVPEGAEGRAVVGDVDEGEEIGDRSSVLRMDR